ncbi:MAG: DUF1566 domain-containing protein, partial [Deltaproteobacteria bacterium]|nr:DUF1566 domain-containing protein [Deltaproteobacteria bacterium]
NGGCDVLTSCTNTAGSRTCGACPAGFTGSGEAGCTDVDECAAGNGGCDARTQCTNTPGSRTCGPCPAGFTGAGETGCTDVDECATGNGGCDVLTSCTNTAGSRTCGACPAGFSGTGEAGCTDVDECAAGNGGCDVLTSCADLVGSRACGACPAGWEGTGETGCIDPFGWVAGPVAPDNPPETNYQVSEGVVTDLATGLHWQQAVPATQHTWEQAKAYCAALTLAGGGWRLPSNVELHSLTSFANWPTLDPIAFPSSPDEAYWSATPAAWDPAYAWVVYFDTGGMDAYLMVRSGHVRCVR